MVQINNKDMKTINLILACLFAVTVSFAQKSPKMQAKGNINGTKIIIDYGAPSVKGRTIWGGLEKYGQVWRAGANENTTVSFDKDVKVGGKELAAGKYGFFIIPNESGDWVVIFSKKNDAWGAFSYAESDDALRLMVKPEFQDDVQEQLMYAVDNSGIVFGWDKVQLHVGVE
jgi:hypothetical protein